MFQPILYATAWDETVARIIFWRGTEIVKAMQLGYRSLISPSTWLMQDDVVIAVQAQ